MLRRWKEQKIDPKALRLKRIKNPLANRLLHLGFTFLLPKHELLLKGSATFNIFFFYLLSLDLPYNFYILIMDEKVLVLCEK